MCASHHAPHLEVVSGACELSKLSHTHTHVGREGRSQLLTTVCGVFPGVRNTPSVSVPQCSASFSASEACNLHRHIVTPVHTLNITAKRNKQGCLGWCAVWAAGLYMLSCCVCHRVSSVMVARVCAHSGGAEEEAGGGDRQRGLQVQPYFGPMKYNGMADFLVGVAPPCWPAIHHVRGSRE